MKPTDGINTEKRACDLFNGTPKLLALLAVAAMGAASPAFAASQTWTNAPVDATWINTNNWVGRAIPGSVNPAAGSLSGDTATFNAPLPASGVGGVANPVINDNQRDIGYILFDTANCGAYVIGTIQGNQLQLSGSSGGRNIAINAPVASPVVINAPVYVRLPSSTNGRYDVNNNASSPSATLTLDYVFNTSATSRPLTLNLGGSNSGANTVRGIGGTSGNGAIHLVKQGTGIWIINTNGMTQRTSGGDNIPASVAVNQGTLIVTDPTSLGGITRNNITVQSGGILQINGITLNNDGITLNSGGTLLMNGSATVNSVRSGTGIGVSAILATTSGTDVMTVGIVSPGVTGGAVDSVLHVSGPGTVFLSQPANYVGSWALDAGTTQVGAIGALGTGASLGIGAGATLDLTLLGATLWSLETTALAGSGNGTAVGSTAATIKADPGAVIDLATGSKSINLTYTPTAFTGDTAHPALYVFQGTLSLGGNTITINNASGTPLGLGTYTIIRQASGTVSDGGGYGAVVTGSGLASGTAGIILVSGGNVNLQVISATPDNLVWTGDGVFNQWDTGASTTWLNGTTPSVFNYYDNATFNSVGLANPTVSLVGTLLPTSVTVDTAGSTYSFVGTGKIGGTTGLNKVGRGTLQLQTANTYLGTTTISDGSVQVGVSDALPTAGAVNVASPGVLDLNGNNQTIGALNGNGTVDTLVGGAPVLTVGGSANTTFSGVIQNTVGLTKNGFGSLTLSGANSYSGPTTVNAGQLIMGSAGALGLGTTALSTTDGGQLDLNGHDLVITGLAGSSGGITNSGTTGTNTLTVLNGGGATYSGVIGENASGAKNRLVLLGNSELRFWAANTYSGGSTVGSGATLAVRDGGSFGTGSIVLSNNATLYLHNSGSPSASAGNPITVPEENAVFILRSGQTANNYSGLVTAPASATNSITGNISLGANNAQQYASFPGRVVLQPGVELRWGASNPINNGGNNTTFEVNGTMHIRGATSTSWVGTVALGALVGMGNIDNPAGDPNGYGNFLIGGKGVSTVYSGTFSGRNHLVKVGAGSLSMNGAIVTTNTDEATYTNYLYAPAVSHIGNTIVSNGVLALVVPNNLSNSPAITLAGAGAVLDATLMGYVQDQIDPGSLMVTNQVLVTNGVFELYSGQTLAGVGTLQGSLRADSGSTVSPGNSVGTLTVSGAATLGGLVMMELNRTNASRTSDEIAAGSFTAIGDLVVTNAGPDVVNGDSFTLFNRPVSGFATVTLPATTSGGSTYVWNNKLAVDGTIQLVSGGISPVNTTPTNITAVVSGSTLTMSWPADHTGWRLLVQTNKLASGISTNPLDWGTVDGSAATNQVFITIDPAKPTEFYRMAYP